MLTKILLAGDGGQGIQSIADMICKPAFNSGLQVSYIPNFGLEQRGGVSLAFIQISDKEIVYPKFTKPDVLLIMSAQAKERVANYLTDGVKIIDTEDYKNIFTAEKIMPQSQNIYFLGMLAKILEKEKIINSADTFAYLKKKLEKKNGWAENERAFNCGLK